MFDLRIAFEDENGNVIKWKGGTHYKNKKDKTEDYVEINQDEEELIEKISRLKKMIAEILYAK